jgi:phenylpropionate dioxygenase-like ring-hydroxylating dioxygenase large terminal subunit
MALLDSLHIEADIARAWTLAAPLYFDPSIAVQEEHKMFSRTWQVVGHHDQVAQPGDYFTTQLVREPVLIVRGSDFCLRGFYNVCRHRKLFRCVYSGWTYNLDGSLNHATEIEGVGGFKPQDFALVPVRCEEWFNLFFVNLDPNAAPLMQTLADLPSQANTSTSAV